MDNVKTDEELTSTMGNVLSTSKEEKNDGSDATPTSSTDASTNPKASQTVSDDPISSTSSDTFDQSKLPDMNQSIVDEPTRMQSEDHVGDLLEIPVSNERITEDVEDLVHDLESLLGETTEPFSLPSKQRESKREGDASTSKLVVEKDNGNEEIVEKSKNETNNIETDTGSNLMEGVHNIKDNIKEDTQQKDVTSLLSSEDSTIILSQDISKSSKEDIDSVETDITSKAEESLKDDCTSEQTIQDHPIDSGVEISAQEASEEVDSVYPPPDVDADSVGSWELVDASETENYVSSTPGPSGEPIQAPFSRSTAEDITSSGDGASTEINQDSEENREAESIQVEQTTLNEESDYINQEIKEQSTETVDENYAENSVQGLEGTVEEIQPVETEELIEEATTSSQTQNTGVLNVTCQNVEQSQNVPSPTEITSSDVCSKFEAQVEVLTIEEPCIDQQNTEITKNEEKKSDNIEQTEHIEIKDNVSISSEIKETKTIDISVGLQIDSVENNLEIMEEKTTENEEQENPNLANLSKETVTKETLLVDSKAEECVIQEKVVVSKDMENEKISVTEQQECILQIVVEDTNELDPKFEGNIPQKEVEVQETISDFVESGEVTTDKNISDANLIADTEVASESDVKEDAINKDLTENLDTETIKQVDESQTQKPLVPEYMSAKIEGLSKDNIELTNEVLQPILDAANVQEEKVEEKVKTEDKKIEKNKNEPITTMNENESRDETTGISKIIVLEDTSKKAVLEDTSKKTALGDSSEKTALEDSSKKMSLENSKETELEDTTIKTALEDSSKKIALEDTSIKTVLEDTSKKTGLEDSSKKTALEDSSKKTALEDTSIKTVLEGTSKKTGLEDYSKKTALEDSSKKTALEDSSIKTALEETSIKAVLEDVSKKTSLEDTANITELVDVSKKSALEDASNKTELVGVSKITSLEDTSNKTELVDVYKKTLEDTTNKTELVDASKKILEDASNKTELVDVSKKIALEDTSNKTELVDVSKKTALEDTSNKTELEDVPKIPALEDPSNKTELVDASKKILEDAAKKTELEDVPKIPALEDTSNKTELADVPKISALEDASNKTELVDFSKKTALEDTSNKTELVDVPKKTPLVDVDVPEINVSEKTELENVLIETKTPLEVMEHKETITEISPFKSANKSEQLKDPSLIGNEVAEIVPQKTDPQLITERKPSHLADLEFAPLQLSEDDSDDSETVPRLALDPDESNSPVIVETIEIPLEDIPPIEEILENKPVFLQTVIPPVMDNSDNLETMLAVASLQNIDIPKSNEMEHVVSEKERREMEALAIAVQSITDNSSSYAYMETESSLQEVIQEDPVVSQNIGPEEEITITEPGTLGESQKSPKESSTLTQDLETQIMPEKEYTIAKNSEVLNEPQVKSVEESTVAKNSEPQVKPVEESTVAQNSETQKKLEEESVLAQVTKPLEVTVTMDIKVDDPQITPVLQQSEPLVESQTIVEKNAAETLDSEPFVDKPEHKSDMPEVKQSVLDLQKEPVNKPETEVQVSNSQEDLEDKINAVDIQQSVECTKKQDSISSTEKTIEREENKNVDTNKEKVIKEVIQEKPVDTNEKLKEHASQSSENSQDATNSTNDAFTKENKKFKSIDKSKKCKKADKYEELTINVDVPEREIKFSPKITIKPIKVPDEEVSTTTSSDSEVSKGSLKMTITKQADNMHSILKINEQENSEALCEQDEPIPKLIIKPKIQQVEQQHSPKMSTRSSKVSPTASSQRAGSPRITIKPVIKPDKSEPVSPLKIKINTKVNTKSSAKEEEVTRKVLIKSIKLTEEVEQIQSPRITIKPIPKPETEKEINPKLMIKCIKKPEEDIENEEIERSSPKIIIKPLIKPQEVEPTHAHEEDEVKERIVLKINKGNLPSPIKESKKREHAPDEINSEKLAKITVKFSKEGGHPHIVHQQGDEITSKRPHEEVSANLEKNKKQKIEVETIISTRSSARHKEQLEANDKITSPLEAKSKHKDPSHESPVEPKRARKDNLNDKSKLLKDDSSDVLLNETKVDSPIVISEDSRSQDSGSVILLDDSKDDSVSLDRVRTPDSSRGTPKAVYSEGESATQSPILKRGRGRPRKVPLEIREELKPLEDFSKFKDSSKTKETKSSLKPQIHESGRPKRSCRGQSVCDTLGIKPRKPRGPGRGRGSKRAMGNRPVADDGDHSSYVKNTVKDEINVDKKEKLEFKADSTSKNEIIIIIEDEEKPPTPKIIKKTTIKKKSPEKEKKVVSEISIIELNSEDFPLSERYLKTLQNVEKHSEKKNEGTLESMDVDDNDAEVEIIIENPENEVKFPVPDTTNKEVILLKIKPPEIGTKPEKEINTKKAIVDDDSAKYFASLAPPIPKDFSKLDTSTQIVESSSTRKNSNPEISSVSSSTIPAEVMIVDEETRMSADTNSRAQTPAKQVLTSTDLVEESQSSVHSTATTESGKTPSRPSKAPRLEVQESDSQIITADLLTEYYWNGNGPFMLQEQVAQFLCIKSFKRKYPGIMRRMLDMQERDFIREKGLASEHMCDLGLTAVNSADILDIMYSDFQDKYEEYCKNQRDRQAKELISKQKALTLATSQEKNRVDITEQAVHSAAQWNARFNKERKEQRKACMDLQNLTVHFPKGKKLAPLTEPHPGNYPIALVPGQFAEFYKEYTPTELNNIPINTMGYDEIHFIPRDDSDESGSESDSDSSGSSTSSSSSSSDSDSSSGIEDCNLCKHSPKKVIPMSPPPVTPSAAIAK